MGLDPVGAPAGRFAGWAGHKAEGKKLEIGIVIIGVFFPNMLQYILIGATAGRAALA